MGVSERRELRHFNTTAVLPQFALILLTAALGAVDEDRARKPLYGTNCVAASRWLHSGLRLTPEFFEMARNVASPLVASVLEEHNWTTVERNAGELETDV